MNMSAKKQPAFFLSHKLVGSLSIWLIATGCCPINRLSLPSMPRGLGQMFKLYLTNALGQ